MDIPSWSPFPELFDRAYHDKLHFALHDYSDQKSMVSAQVLHSVLAARNHLRGELNAATFEQLQRDDEDVFIFVLAPPGWEYTVYMLAILALGAAISPMSIMVLPEEARYFINIAKGSTLLFAKSLTASAAAIKEDIVQNDSELFKRLQFIEMKGEVPINMPCISYSDIQPKAHPRPNRAGSLLFTSGSSGKPKGVVHSYNAIIAAAKVRAQGWNLNEKDVFISQKPGNWMGDFYPLLPCLMTGAEIEFCLSVFNPEWIWNRVKDGDVTFVDLLPDTWEKLGEYYHEKIASLSEIERKPYFDAMVNVRWTITGASPLPSHIQQMWTSLRGKPLNNQYGATEVMPISQTNWQGTIGDCSVGTPMPGVEVKIVDGELRVRAPWMFSRYISEDPTLTQASLDNEGFYKTGDCAKITNNNLTLLGRASIDTIRFCGWKMHAGTVEEALNSLPYITLVLVFGIPDPKYHERVAAILRFQPSPSTLVHRAPTLKELHQDLTAKTNIPRFQFPTIVYWLWEGEDVPRMKNGKVSKFEAKRLVGERMGKGWEGIEVMDLEEGGSVWDTAGEKWKAWDWGGIS